MYCARTVQSKSSDRVAQAQPFFDSRARARRWDTAGQEKFKSIARAYYRGANVLVAVFDLSSSESLLNLEGWLRVASETAQPDALRFLIGTKRDLVVRSLTPLTCRLSRASLIQDYPYVELYAIEPTHK